MLDGTKIRAASEHEAVAVLVCTRVCVHVPTCVLYEADTSITYSSVLSAGLPHSVFQRASQSLCHMHYLRLALPLMQIAAEIFMLDVLTYRLSRRRSVQISRPHVDFFLLFSTSGRAGDFLK